MFITQMLLKKTQKQDSLYKTQLKSHAEVKRLGITGVVFLKNNK